MPLFGALQWQCRCCDMAALATFDGADGRIPELGVEGNKGNVDRFTAATTDCIRRET